MSLTEKLLAVHMVDTKLRTLQERLRAAERFLNEQERRLAELTSQKAAMESQQRQLKATVGNIETETSSVDVRIERLRVEMNEARTNKEYKVFLTEINTLRAEKGRFEEQGVGLLDQTEQIDTKLAEIDGKIEERTKVRDVAKQDRATRESEIADKVAELERERDVLRAELPDHVLDLYGRLLDTLEDEAMAPIEIQDRKRHEFTCGACMMSLPVETMSTLMSSGEITRCVSCGCILYLEENSREAMTAGKR